VKRSGPIKRRKPMRRAGAKAKARKATPTGSVAVPTGCLTGGHSPEDWPRGPVIMSPQLYDRLAAEMGVPGFKWPHPMAAVPDWRSSTTARRPGTAQAKLPAVLSPTLLAWVRQQPCELPELFLCGHWLHPRETHPGGDPHHVPTTGSNGRQIDDLVVACCRQGHTLAHAGNFDAQAVEAAAHRTMVRFRRLAPLDVQQRVAAEIVACLYNEGG